MTDTPDSNVPPQESAPPVAPPIVDSNKDERNWAMFCHLAALAGLSSIPFANIIGPLIIWLIKKDEYPLVDREGKKAMNFQLTISIAILICIPLMFVIIGFFLIAALGITSLVCTIIAAVRTSEGRDYEYPYSIKFFS